MGRRRKNKWEGEQTMDHHTAEDGRHMGFFHESSEDDWYGRRGAVATLPPPLPPPPDVAIIVTNGEAIPPPEEIRVHDGKVFTLFTNPLFSADVPDTRVIKKVEKPEFHWKGAKLTVEQWRSMLAFFKWSFDTYKAEATCRLYYHEAEHRWAIVVFPQRMTKGLSVKDELDAVVAGEMLAAGFTPAGSGHHHCSTGAFQSGTDKADEEKSPGFHFTVGNLDKQDYDLHFRYTFRGHTYPVEMQDFVDFLPAIQQIPEFLRVIPGMSATICKRLAMTSEGAAFPEEWKAKCLPPVEERQAASFAATGGTPVVLGTTPPLPYSLPPGPVYSASANALPEGMFKCIAAAEQDGMLRELDEDCEFLGGEERAVFRLIRVFDKCFGAPLIPENDKQIEDVDNAIAELEAAFANKPLLEGDLELVELISELRDLWDSYPANMEQAVLRDVLNCPAIGVRYTAEIYRANGFLFGMPEFNWKCAKLREANQDYSRMLAEERALMEVPS